MNINGLELKEYRYKELCSLFGEEPKTSKNPKAAQLKEWHRHFDWANVTTQRYLVTEIYNEPKEKNNNHGGFREGSGRKHVLQEEFETLFNAFLRQEMNRNMYNGKALKEAYFTNSSIMRYFSMMKDGFYNAKEDPNVDIGSYNAVYTKMLSNKSVWITNKIKRMEDVTLSYGLIGYRDTGRGFIVEYPNDKLPVYDTMQEEYLKQTKQRIYSVIQNDNWNDMVEYISDCEEFRCYSSVCKCRRVSFPIDTVHEYDMDDIERCRAAYNMKNAESIIRYFEKKGEYDTQKIKYIVETYIAA